MSLRRMPPASLAVITCSVVSIHDTRVTTQPVPPKRASRILPQRKNWRAIHHKRQALPVSPIAYERNMNIALARRSSIASVTQCGRRLSYGWPQRKAAAACPI